MDRKNWLKMMLPKVHIIRTSSNAGESNMETENNYQGKPKN